MLARLMISNDTDRRFEVKVLSSMNTYKANAEEELYNTRQTTNQVTELYPQDTS